MLKEDRFVLLAQIKRMNSQALWNKLSEGNRWTYLVIGVVLLVGLFFIVVKIREWLVPKGLTDNSSEDMLMQFRDIHQQGELTADEFKAIRERLAKRSGESKRAGRASSGPSADDSAKRPSKTEL